MGFYYYSEISFIFFARKKHFLDQQVTWLNQKILFFHLRAKENRSCIELSHPVCLCID